MNNPRNGKIARLPQTIREELNRRLMDGETARSLVPWLNGLETVKSVVTREFGGRPVREQNISEWRRGGYREWLQQQEAVESVRRFNSEVAELRDSEVSEITDNAALWLVTRYIVAAKKLEG